MALVENCMRQAIVAHADGGILEAACLAHLESGGKRTRAWLTLKTLEILNADLAMGIEFAAAVELLHNASLIHDDLEDGDRMRRGRPTVSAQFGDAQALNAGDFMLLLPGLLLAESGLAKDVSQSVSALLARSALATAAGQSRDLGLLEAGATSFDAYARAAGGKTAPFFSLPVQGAALIAGWEKSEAELVTEPFTRLGLLYQMCDDHADLYGEKGREEPGNDIAEGKISLLVVEHLKARPAEREKILRILRKDRAHTTPDVIKEVRQAFIESGAQKATQTRILEEAAAIASHPVLDRNPVILPLVSALLDRILKGSGIPSQHILSHRGQHHVG
jgi:geranylgeranyl pyrophosphate synthase